MKTVPRPGCAAAGFSRVELLVVLAIILILAMMLYDYGSDSRQRSKKLLCADNLQKIYLAMQVYVNDFNGQPPQNPNAVTSEPVLDKLVPRYTADTTIFICPGGRDSQIPSGEPLVKRKISYAYYMGRRLDPPQSVLMSDRQVDTQPKAAGEWVFSHDGKPPGNNHRNQGGNFLFCDGSVQPSQAQLTFSLPATPGVVLLNPKP
jgi:prepilin-type processing-associated H-X9-DG protein/prepilin-type N-terminal cleavage/methylation domain-containing protein